MTTNRVTVLLMAFFVCVPSFAQDEAVVESQPEAAVETSTESSVVVAPAENSTPAPANASQTAWQAMMAERYEAHLKQSEARQAAITARHQAMMEQAQARRDYIEKHHEEMLKEALDQESERQAYFQSLKEEAETRKQSLAEQREAFESMTPQARAEFMQEKIMEQRQARPMQPMPRNWQRPPMPWRAPVR